MINNIKIFMVHLKGYIRRPAHYTITNFKNRSVVLGGRKFVNLGSERLGTLHKIYFIILLGKSENIWVNIYKTRLGNLVTHDIRMIYNT